MYSAEGPARSCSPQPPGTILSGHLGKQGQRPTPVHDPVLPAPVKKRDSKLLSLPTAGGYHPVAGTGPQGKRRGVLVGPGPGRGRAARGPPRALAAPPPPPRPMSDARKTFKQAVERVLWKARPPRLASKAPRVPSSAPLLTLGGRADTRARGHNLRLQRRPRAPPHSTVRALTS